MQKYIIQDEFSYYDFIYWITSQAMNKVVGVVGQKDLLLYLTEELLKLEHLCFSADDALINNLNSGNACFLLLDMEQGTIDIKMLDDFPVETNIVCLMEDCMDFLPKFYRYDEDDVYICCYGEDK